MMVMTSISIKIITMNLINIYFHVTPRQQIYFCAQNTQYIYAGEFPKLLNLLFRLVKLCTFRHEYSFQLHHYSFFFQDLYFIILFLLYFAFSFSPLIPLHPAITTLLSIHVHESFTFLFNPSTPYLTSTSLCRAALSLLQTAHLQPQTVPGKY